MVKRWHGNVLSATYSIRPNSLLATRRDRASVNNVAMHTILIIYPNLLDIGCLCHTLNCVGEHFNVSNLTEFIPWWISLFSHSPKSKLLWKAQTGKAMTTFSATRWWSKFEVMKQLLKYFGEIEPFLHI